MKIKKVEVGDTVDVTISFDLGESWRGLYLRDPATIGLLLREIVKTLER